MISFIHEHAFFLVCVYGIVWSVVLRLAQRERPSGVPFVIYLFGFLGLSVAMGSTGVTVLRGRSGMIAVAGQFLLYVSMACIVVACNALPLLHTLAFVLGMMGKELAGLNQIVLRKTYDRATGAESRGDFEAAAHLYRAEIEEHPDDTEARRRLAEVLLRAGKMQEAAAELRSLIDVIGDGEQACLLTFRLAEITDEHLHDRQEAARIYERLIRKYPKSKLAGYARMRLQGKETPNAPR